MGVTTIGLSNTVRAQSSDVSRSSKLRDLNGINPLRVCEVILDAITVFTCAVYGFRLFEWKLLRLPIADSEHVGLIAFISSWAMVILLDRAGMYRASGGLLRLRETASILGAAFFALLVVIPSIFLFHLSQMAGVITLLFVVVVVGLVLEKHLFHTLLARLRPGAVGHRRVLIYGNDTSARALFFAFARSPKLGFTPIALVDEGKNAELNEPIQGSGVVTVVRATFNALLVRQHRADLVVISSPFRSKGHLQHVIHESRAAGAVVAFGAESVSLEHSELEYIELDGQCVYGEHHVRTPWFYAVSSRVLDIVGSSIALLLAGIPLLLTALLIVMESPGPVLFRQQRAGRYGIPFTIFKFRTMYEQRCGDSASPVDSRDPRITRIGKWLRRTSLDELPQILNVLRGDMALVGPRPEMLFVVAAYGDHERKRLSVKPGLTGIWQISADRRYPIHENLHYDLYYLKYRSISMDIAVILHTLVFAVRGS